VTAVFAHRGCTEGFTENTIDAFAEARRLGADGVELDVRLTADGALAIHHDAEIPGLGSIAKLEVADLPAHVPLLADVLAVCEGMVVNVEIKNAPQDPGWDAGEAVAALTAAAIEEAGWTSRVIVSSFQMATLRAVQAADGRLALGALWGAGGGRGVRVRRRPPFRRVREPRARPAGACNGACGQRLDRQCPRGSAGHDGRGGGHGDHRPAARGPGRRRVSHCAATTGGRRLGKGACHRAEWRGTALVHKDGRP
jgi:hypothetical protein